MNDKKIVPFPFSMWSNLTVGSKRMVIAGVFIVIIFSMYTGDFSGILDLFKAAK